MSVAEALRALDRAMAPRPWRASAAWASHQSWWDIQAGNQLVAETPRIPERKNAEIPNGAELVALRNALPLIADVVEAAEGLRNASEPLYREAWKFDAALISLRDALEEAARQ